jgi:hypothetical protein
VQLYPGHVVRFFGEYATMQRAVAAGDVTTLAPRRPSLAQIFTEVIQ